MVVKPRIVACYIPSHKRAGQIKTLDVLPPMLRPIIVVRSSELSTYKKEYKGVEVIGTPPSIKGLGKTRRFICKHSVKQGYALHCQLDDDITGWLYCDDPTMFGGVKKATAMQTNRRWNTQITRALKFQAEGQGFAVSFPWRAALAYPHKPIKHGVRLGLVNACKMMNMEAAKVAEFGPIDNCDDVLCTVKWLLDGVVAGQDPYLGHTEQTVAALDKSKGGMGEWREDNPNSYYTGHLYVHKRFPHICAEPKDVGKWRPKTRVGYQKAAKLGGVID